MRSGFGLFNNARDYPAGTRIPYRFPGNTEYFHSIKKQNTKSPSGPAVSLGYVIITLVITPPIAIYARVEAIFMALNSCVHYR